MNEEMFLLTKSDINEMLLYGAITIVVAIVAFGLCLYSSYRQKAETFRAKEAKLRDEKIALKRELKEKTSLIKRQEDNIWLLKTIISEMQGVATVQNTPPEEEIISFSPRKERRKNLI